MKNTCLIILVSLITAVQAHGRTIISKCAVDGQGLIEKDSAFFYVFGDRIIDDSGLVTEIKNLEVLHDIAAHPEVTSSRNELANLDPAKIRPATLVGDALTWEHEPIYGKVSSSVRGIIRFRVFEEDDSGSPTRGIQTALASIRSDRYPQGFGGRYPYCRFFGTHH